MFRCGAELNRLSVRRVIEEAATRVFGVCGAGSLSADVVRAGGGRALLRVRARALRRLRAALALRGGGLRALRLAPSLQALL